LEPKTRLHRSDRGPWPSFWQAINVWEIGKDKQFFMLSSLTREETMMTERRSVEHTIRDIRRRARKKYSAEEKICIVLEGLRGEESIAELRRKEGLNLNVYYRWSKDFLFRRKSNIKSCEHKQR
jgi:hypothetical protein